MQSWQRPNSNPSEPPSFPKSTVTQLPRSALIGRRVLLVSNSSLSTEAILSVIQSLGADRVRTTVLSSKFSIQSFFSMSASMFKSDLMIYSMAGTRPDSVSLVTLLATTLLAKLSHRQFVLHLPDILAPLLPVWQRTVIDNAASVSSGLLLTDSRQLDNEGAGSRPAYLVSCPPVKSATRPPAQAGLIQPSIIALAASEEEELLLERVLTMTKQKYPRAELKIMRASQPVTHHAMNSCDVALILSPSAYRLDFVQSALAAGLTPILPQSDLPGITPGSGLGLSIQPLDVPQAVSALCRLVEEPELVATLRVNGAHYVKSQSLQVVLEGWGNALGAILTRG